MSIKSFAPILITLAVLALVYALDLPKTLGAHPWWSHQVVLVSGGLGIVAGFFLKRAQPISGAGMMLVMAISGYILAGIGKEQFAISFAEDKLAGQIWYFSWHATLFGLAGFIYIASALGIGRLNR